MHHHAVEIVATDRLDMTQRPRLSDRVVFTVDAPRASFWRGQTFDTWDQHEWTQSDPRSVPLVSEWHPTGSSKA